MPIGTGSPLRRLSALNLVILDGALAFLLVVGTWLWDFYGPDLGRSPDLLSVTLTLIANGPLALRRRAPLTVLVISTMASLTYHVLGYHLALNTIGMLVALYTVGAHRSWKPSLAGAALAVPVWTHASALQDDVVFTIEDDVVLCSAGAVRAPGGLRTGHGRQQATAGRSDQAVGRSRRPAPQGAGRRRPGCH
ncbi:hypothetical protein ABT120_16130 [Nonomuraea angiospora]|uniref:DUF7134 domain-containing protein n=1 Tax=Nonomuraea angiospora TaxID=46172 RepID=UPI00333149D6